MKLQSAHSQSWGPTWRLLLVEEGSICFQSYSQGCWKVVALLLCEHLQRVLSWCGCPVPKEQTMGQSESGRGMEGQREREGGHLRWNQSFQNLSPETSLVVQRLKLCTPMQGSRLGTLVRELDTTRGHAKSPQACLTPWDLIDCSPEPLPLWLPYPQAWSLSSVQSLLRPLLHTIIFALPTLDLFHCLEPMGRHHHSALNSILKMLVGSLAYPLCQSLVPGKSHYQISLFLLSGQRLWKEVKKKSIKNHAI